MHETLAPPRARSKSSAHANLPGLETLLAQPWSDIFDIRNTRQIAAGTYLYRESERCTHFMWLLEGSVRVFKHSSSGREITLYRVTPGELCVLSLQCLLEDKGFPAVAVAETELRGLSLSKTEFDHAIDNSAEFRRYLLRTLSRRLGDVVQLVSDVTFHRLELRLTCLLSRLFRESGDNTIQVTHARLAQELGTTREMISRILKELELRRCIRLHRGKIQLVSTEAFPEMDIG